MKTNKPIFLIILLLLVFGRTRAQFIDSSIDRVKTPLQVNMKRIGSINPRSTKDIKSSRITVGCETLDRDHTVWDNYKDYLPPLGVKKIRLQAVYILIEKYTTY